MSKAILTKAHSKCAVSKEGDEEKWVAGKLVPKQHFKKPCKSKQTPVHRRNVARVQISVNTLKKHLSCQNLEVLQKDENITQCNKSKSYDDLKTIIQAESNINFIGTTKIMGENSKDSTPVHLDIVGNRVIKEACTAFLLNAWRHRRQEVADIKKKIVALENQTTDLRVQIMSLWQLLESEKARLAQANLKAMQQHVLAEDAIVNNKTLTAINATQEKEIKELNKEVYSLRTECNNQKNELMITKQELFSLHNQMDKERVKVSKLREDKKILLDKAHAAEIEAKKKTALLYQNETEQKERQEAQLTLLQNLQEKNILVEELNKDKTNLLCEIEEKDKNNGLLSQQVTELEKLIQEKEREIEVLKNTSHGYMVEAVRMKLASLEIEDDDDDVKKSWPVRTSRWLTATIIMAVMSLLQTAAFP